MAEKTDGGGTAGRMAEAWQQASKEPGRVIEFDRNWVVCDYCNADFTGSDETGGTLIHTNAVCPGCTRKHAASIALDKQEHPRLIREPKPGETFADFVIRMRGAEGNRIVITNFERKTKDS